MGFKVLKSSPAQSIQYKHGNVFHCINRYGHDRLFILIKAYDLHDHMSNRSPWHLATIKGDSQWYGLNDRLRLDWEKIFEPEFEVTMYDSIQDVPPELLGNALAGRKE